MPHIDKHPPGSFSWLELGTSDQGAAKSFYGALFGWQANDFPMGPDGTYTIFQIEGRDAAAGYQLGPQMAGVPPHWALYIAVDSADQTAGRAGELGGTVLKGAFDVGDFGRMAVIQDPTGAVFCIWQAKTNTGIGIAGFPGTLCWADLNTPDRDRARAFYEGLFGWTMTTGKSKDPSSYLHIMNGESGIGGILPEDYRNKHAPPHWLPYILVADCDASTAKAKELGATIYAPPMTIENSLRFSVLADPQGAVFALFMAMH
jgi:predicted enzyme related to lactoylglutathione lyase